jgi:hypothetical protein
VESGFSLYGFAFLGQVDAALGDDVFKGHCHARFGLAISLAAR